jgi:hypothetical protein
MGSVDDPASCRQLCIRTKTHPTMGENRPRSLLKLADPDWLVVQAVVR